MKLAQDLGVLDDGIPYAMAFKCVLPTVGRSLQL
jgi:hypothetical protein